MDCKKLLLGFMSIATLNVSAHDHLNLEHGVPLEIEDAYESRVSFLYDL
jgi:hypothetical protein